MRILALGLILLVAARLVALAQAGKHVAIGAGFVINEYSDSDFSQGNPSPTFEYRIKLKPGSRHGWNWTLTGAFDGFRPGVDRDIAGQSVRVGQLRTRPVMAGVEREGSEGPVTFGLSLPP